MTTAQYYGLGVIKMDRLAGFQRPSYIWAGHSLVKDSLGSLSIKSAAIWLIRPVSLDGNRSKKPEAT